MPRVSCCAMCSHNAPTLHPHGTHTAPTLHPHCTHVPSMLGTSFVAGGASLTRRSPRPPRWAPPGDARGMPCRGVVRVRARVGVGVGVLPATLLPPLPRLLLSIARAPVSRAARCAVVPPPCPPASGPRQSVEVAPHQAHQAYQAQPKHTNGTLTHTHTHTHTQPKRAAASTHGTAGHGVMPCTHVCAA